MSSTPDRARIRLGRALEILSLSASALVVLYIVLVLTGPNVAHVRPATENFVGADQNMSVRGDLAFPVDFGDRLTWTETEAGTRDAATGLAPVEIGGPVQVELTFWDPTRAQRASWAVRQLLAPTLALAGILILYRMLRSTRTGDPFTLDNEHRLWWLAGLVAIGGSLNSFVTDFVDRRLIQDSAASDLFHVTATFSFLPLVVGLVIAMLALVWRIGISMREDLEGTI